MTANNPVVHRRKPVRLSPAKLLLSKWTAATPRNKEKHFIITRIVQPELPALAMEFVEFEAVYSRRSFILHWRELTDVSEWLQGWR